MIELTLGADPEVFLTHKGLLTSSCRKIGGTKFQPKPITNKTWVQEDNVTVEFNFEPVKYNGPGTLYKAAGEALQEVRQHLASLDKDYGIHIASMANVPDINNYSEAWVFGCDPDRNAYLQGQLNDLRDPSHETTRYAGGHIHFGYDTSATEIPKFALVQLCDLAAIAVSKYDLIGRNRSGIYGAAGSYRDKPYGFEYRTPSCEWLPGGNKAGQELVDAITSMVYWALNNPKKTQELWTKYTARIQNRDTATVNLLNSWCNQSDPTVKYLKNLYHEYVKSFSN